MDNNSKEQHEPSPSADKDLWVRGVAHANHRHALVDAEMETQELEQRVARARYEYEIAQRIHAKAASEEARKDWEIQVSVAHDVMVMEEQELAEAAESAAYHRTMAAEIEADLGDKAEVYAAILADFDWDEDDEDMDEICPFMDECPLLYGEDECDEYEIYEDEEDEADLNNEEVPF
jgi:hypothetical protein